MMRISKFAVGILFLAFTGGIARAEQPSLFRVQSPPPSPDSVGAFHTPELHAAIARELGAGTMRRAEGDQQVSSPVQNVNGILVGKSCALNACGTDEVLWAVSRIGNVYVRLVYGLRMGDRVMPMRDSFGSAPQEINRIFDGMQ